MQEVSWREGTRQAFIILRVDPDRVETTDKRVIRTFELTVISLSSQSYPSVRPLRFLDSRVDGLCRPGVHLFTPFSVDGGGYSHPEFLISSPLAHELVLNQGTLVCGSISCVKVID